MDTSQVEKDLFKRIEQSKAWLEDGYEAIAGISFRNCRWSAIPVEFLDDPRRVERHGVAFDFDLNDPSRELKVRLKVRIKPEATIGEKDDSPPYVVVYITNQKTGTDDSIGWHHIRVPSSYQDLTGLSIQDWYRKWIMHALTSKGAKKIFSPDMKLES